MSIMNKRRNKDEHDYQKKKEDKYNDDKKKGR